MSTSAPPPPPPPPTPAPPPAAPGGAGSRRWVVPVAVVAAVAVVVGVVGFVVLGGDEAGAEVTLESVTDPGPDPFSESMAVVEVAEFPGDVEAVITDARAELPRDDGTLRAAGTDPGLYGGTQDETVCDADRLIAFLDENPDRAQAWASVQGIAVDDLADFIGSLTSVVLTVDTWVTNHGFADGQATPRQSVLQAGNAVMVDDRGAPRVKCGCGNPLLEPSGSADLAGADNAWAGYDPDQVATVDPGDQTDTLTVIDIQTGDTYQQDVGGVGGLDAATQELIGLTYSGSFPLGEEGESRGGFLLRGPQGEKTGLSVASESYRGKRVLLLLEEVDRIPGDVPGTTRPVWEVIAVQFPTVPPGSQVWATFCYIGSGGPPIDAVSSGVVVVAPSDGGTATEAWRADPTTRAFEPEPPGEIECEPFVD